VGRELEFSEDKDWLTLTFVIDEGPRYKVHNRVVIGNSKFSAEELTKEAKLKAGDFFNQAQMEADKTKMQDHYGSIGYLFAKVEPDPRFLEEPGQLDLVYNIQEGSRYRVGRVNVKIQGDYPHTRITTALNRMALRPGDIVDTRQLRRSERLMQFSGLFANNPQNGEKPKIVFTPPDKELNDAASEAQKPQRDPSVRGQSPDEDRIIDVEYQGALKPQSQWPTGAVEALESAVTPQQLQPQPQQGTLLEQPQNGRSMFAVGINSDAALAGPEGLPQPQPQQESPQASPQPQNAWPRATVVRGQYTGQDTQPAPGYGSATSGSYPSGNYPPAQFAQVSVPYSSNQPSYGNNGYSAGPSAGNGYPSTVPPSNYSSAGGSANSTSPANGYPSYSNASPSAQAYSGNQPLGGPYGQPGPYGSAPAGAAAPNPMAGPSSQGGSGYQPTPNGASATGTYGAGGAAQSPPQVVIPGVPADNDRVFPRPDDSQFARPLDLDVILKETQTGRLMFGVGINSDAGLVGNVTIDEQNFDITRVPQSFEDLTDGTAFRGAGQRFRIEAAPGTQVSRYMITFQDPFFMDTDFTFGIQGYYYERLYREWTEQRTGGRISLGYQINHDLSATLYTRAEAIDITNPATDPTLPPDPVTGALTVPPALEADVGPSGLYGFGATIAHDTRDSQFLPTEGHLISVNFEQDVGSFQFNSVDVDFRKYFLIYQRPDGSGRQVLTFSSHFGVKSDTTPIFERYYAGGFSSIRGFDFRGVSPTTPGGVHLGGDAEVLASLEYLYPITADDMLRGVIFCDTGTVEPTLSNWSDNYRVAPGFGLRIAVPAMGPAPIALDFAFPVAVNPGDRVLNFSFFVGFGR
jgi:outer membrane protein insertion porin family